MSDLRGYVVLSVHLANGMKATYKIKWECDYPKDPTLEELDSLMFATYQWQDFPKGSFYFVGSRIDDPEDTEDCEILIPIGYLSASWKYYTLEQLREAGKKSTDRAIASLGFTGDTIPLGP